MKSAYRIALDGFALPYGDVAVGGWRNTPYVVIQNVGVYLDTPRFLDAEHPVRTAEDAEAYLARLESYAVNLDGELERLQAAGEQGVIAPAFLLDKAIGQIGISLAEREGRRRTGRKPGPADARTSPARGARAPRRSPRGRSRRRSVVSWPSREPSAPAPRWTPACGPGREGDAYYQWALRASTTTKMTPDEVHQLGQQQITELQAQMDTILKGLGYTKGTVGARMTGLGNYPRFQFPDNDAGRAEILAVIQQRLAMIRAKLPEAFATLVKGNLEVRRLPPEEEPGAPGAYGGAGSIDGSIPGKVLDQSRDHQAPQPLQPADAHAPRGNPRPCVAGRISNQLPLIRTLLAFNAYSEGWALYAEQLADELGVYEGDPVGRLGYLQSIAFRACRLVVDTGLHAKQWTRQQRYPTSSPPPTAPASKR